MRITPFSSLWSFQCWVGKNPHLSPPLSRDMVSTLKVWAVLRHSIPWPCEAEIPRLIWLLDASPGLGEQSFCIFFPSTRVRELSLCKIGERGVDSCDIRSQMPWCGVRRQFLLRGSESKASGSMFSSPYSPWLLWALLFSSCH